MLLSGAWFEIIAATLLTILLLATSYRPPWWFWTGTTHKSNGISEEKDRKPFKTARDVPGPFSLPILGTRWIYSWMGYYRMNKIHEAYKGKDFGLSVPTNLFYKLSNVLCPFAGLRYQVDLNRRYGGLCKEEALWNWPVISVFSRHDIELVLRKGSRYPLRPPQEVISHYRHTRRDRYTNLGLVNEQGETWLKLRSALTPELTGASTVLGFFPALNIVCDGFIELIRKRRTMFGVVGFEELAYKMGLESCVSVFSAKTYARFKTKLWADSQSFGEYFDIT
ncbi:hypothetical protein M0802_017019 [Mischocyttarus mexicanus]|nr:hypothetical protein M0802_017019 [Mischocyttarus mexicanus]